MQRYIRQTTLKAIGRKGQQRLSAAQVVIIGCGGLGSIAAPYLAAAGVGEILLVDGDRIDQSNLHRQVFYRDTDVGSPKAIKLGEHLRSLNPEVTVKVVDQMVSKGNIESILKNVDLVLECTDDIQTKYLVNDYCHYWRIPLIYGAIYQFSGYLSLFENRNEESIHLRDVFPEPNDQIPSCSEVGVLGTLAGIIGLLQTQEAIKFILQVGSGLQGKLLTYDALENQQMMLSLQKTFHRDIAELIARNPYRSIKCTAPTVTVKELFDNRSKYHLVSILEPMEHVNIDPQVIHQPLSKIIPEKWKLDQKDLIPVFYCRSGKRSGNLVEAILKHQPEVEIYSLAGGLIAYQGLAPTQ